MPSRCFLEKLSRAPSFLPKARASSRLHLQIPHLVNHINNTIIVSITHLPCAPNLSTPSATRLPAHLVFGSSRTRCVRRCYLSATLLSPPFWGSFRLPLIARTAPFPSLGALGLLHLPCSVRLDCITQDHAAGRRGPAWTKQTSRVRSRQTTGVLCALVHCFCL